jgi:hypothetical protein
MNSQDHVVRQNFRTARERWGKELSPGTFETLKHYTRDFHFSIAAGDLLYLDRGWYVTHAGLIRLAYRSRCAGIHVRPVPEFADSSSRRWVFQATVFKTRNSKGFVGYGDADPSNVSPLVRGAEMRVAETRAVNRALRKAYGIGICSVEEIGSFSGPLESASTVVKRPPQPSNGNGTNGEHRLRDRLCQLIRQHELDPELVKAYAVDFCGVKTLKDASREQIENFIDHIADWVAKDRNALLCQLNSYPGRQEGIA